MSEQRNLGDALAAALETGPSRSALSAQRAQVLAALSKPASSGPPFLVLALGGGLIATAAVLAMRMAPPSQGELRGAWQGQSLTERSKVVAPAERAETLSFSDGSRLELGARAELSLSKLAPEQAHLQLARGHVDATIRKGTGRAWTLAAGPYSVRVVGTAFSVDWDERSSFFAVNVREGKVLVSGGALAVGGVLLGAGERIERQDPRAVRDEAMPPSSAKQPTASPPPAADPPSSRSVASAAPSPEDDFRVQAGRGDYSAAIVAARRAGFERLERELSAKDLLLRERFPRSASSAHAALLLASQAEDRDKNSSEAEQWLRTFLTESPQGELAAGARARLLATLLKRGARAEAEQVARDYLRLHPSGQHAARAQAVLQASP
jgi:hypothetical protein